MLVIGIAGSELGRPMGSRDFTSCIREVNVVGCVDICAKHTADVTQELDFLPSRTPSPPGSTDTVIESVVVTSTASSQTRETSETTITVSELTSTTTTVVVTI